MAEASIPVDLFNPGQVFACLGFLEAADVLMGDARGGFDWRDEANARFRLAVSKSDNPINDVLMFLRDAQVTSRSAFGLGLDTSEWGIETIKCQNGAPFPFPAPDSPATLVAVLTVKAHDHLFTGKSIEISHWGDRLAESGRDNVKFWAGAAGYPGAALARDSLNLIRQSIVESLEDPFGVWAEQSSSFRFDWRRDYIPIDIGFSLNAHGSTRFRTVGYPIVEILAAIGLTHARPEFCDKLAYRYGVLGVRGGDELFDPFFSRTSLGVFELPFLQRIFHMKLGWPGKKGQARCITTVYEETDNE
jgi:CRISPR-associated protein Csb3